MKKLPVVKIKDNQQPEKYIIINLADFDSGKHERFEKGIKKDTQDIQNIEIQIITKKEASELNRNQLRDYANQFGITGRSSEDILKALDDGGHFCKELVN